MIAYPYIIFFILSFFILLPGKFKGSYKVTTVQYLLASLLFLMCWGYGIVGYDVNEYWYLYYDIPPLSEFNWSDYPRENLFYLYCSIFRSFGFAYFEFRFISTLIDLGFFYLFFKNTLPTRLIGVGFVFFILYGGMYYELEAIRNSKALCFYLISLVFLFKGRYCLFFTLNVIGFYFHISIVTIVFATFLTRFLLNKKLNAIIFSGGVVLSALGYGLTSFLSILVSFNIPYVSFLVNRYLSIDVTPHGVTIGFIERFLAFCLVYHYHDRLLVKYKNVKYFLALFYVFIFINFYFSNMDIMITRVATIFKLSYWIVFPFIYSELSNKNKPFFLIFLLFYGALKVYYQYNDEYYLFQFKYLK